MDEADGDSARTEVVSIESDVAVGTSSTVDKCEAIGVRCISEPGRVVVGANAAAELEEDEVEDEVDDDVEDEMWNEVGALLRTEAALAEAGAEEEDAMAGTSVVYDIRVRSRRLRPLPSSSASSSLDPTAATREEGSWSPVPTRNTRAAGPASCRLPCTTDAAEATLNIVPPTTTSPLPPPPTTSPSRPLRPPSTP